MSPVPTRDRILGHALELFATRGFEAVSVKEITRPLGLTEATLYLYFKNKSTLLQAIFDRLNERLIAPSFSPPPKEYFQGEEKFDVGEFLVSGARTFFRKADRETLLTWRILMINQYRYDSARTGVEEHLLDAPRRFFASMLSAMKIAGKIRTDVDIVGLSRIIAAVFFQYSFRENLKAAWNDPSPDEFERIASDIRFVVRGIAP